MLVRVRKILLVRVLQILLVRVRKILLVRVLQILLVWVHEILSVRIQKILLVRVHEILLVLKILLLLVWVLVSAIVNPNTGKKEEDKAAKKKKIGKQHCEIHTISQEMSKRDEFSSSQSSHQYR